MKGKFEDLAGKEFGRLVVAGYMGSGHWLCKCKCGKKVIVRTDRLKSGHTKSCGCFHKSAVTKHGFWNINYSKGTMKFYKMWQSLKARCDNPNLKCYKNYGGRGITYDPKWESFDGFKKDMYLKYLYAIKQRKIKNPSIERIDVNGNYNKANCTFIEREDQLKNLRSTYSFIAISPDGDKFVEKNVNGFSKKYGFSSSSIFRALVSGIKIYRGCGRGWEFKLLDGVKGED